MGSGRTGCHHHPVKFLFLDHFFHMILGILGTGKQIVLHMDDIGKGCRIIPDRRHIGDTADIDTTITDKHTDTGILS